MLEIFYTLHLMLSCFVLANFNQFYLLGPSLTNPFPRDLYWLSQDTSRCLEILCKTFLGNLLKVEKPELMENHDKLSQTRNEWYMYLPTSTRTSNQIYLVLAWEFCVRFPSFSANHLGLIPTTRRLDLVICRKLRPNESAFPNGESHNFSNVMHQSTAARWANKNSSQ